MNPSPWAPYRPSEAAPWNLERAWTLRRRAGFAATWSELERDLAGGAGPAVDRVLAGECRTQDVPSDFAATAALLGDAATDAADVRRLQAWWLFRTLFTPDPLTERLALAWHNHFATSQLKVADVAALRKQNEIFHRLGRGPFSDLLHEMLRDPALLNWLDAPSNRKGKPNENLARELMELFTLGVGRFTENDVKEAARALTGLTVAQRRFQLRTQYHDDGEKTVLSKTARFDADSLAGHLLTQPAVADRLAWRLCATFLGERVADASAQAGLADQLRRDGLHVGRAVETILRSALFFLPKTCTPASPTRSDLSSARRGRWNSSVHHPAPCCSQSGRGGWVRSCSSRPTSAAGPEADAGSRAEGSWRGPTSRRRWPWVDSGPLRRLPTYPPWRPAMAVARIPSTRSAISANC